MLSQITQPVYDPKGKINPFQPLFKEKPLTGGGILVLVDNGRTNRTALEKIDLSQLKLTGIILAASGNKGLVQESSGRGHVIAKGTYIGTHGGKVTGIQKGKVIVEEKMEDAYGKILIARQELKLNKKEYGYAENSSHTSLTTKGTKDTKTECQYVMSFLRVLRVLRGKIADSRIQLELSR